MIDSSIPLKQCSRKDECLNPLGQWLPPTTEYFYPRTKPKGGLFSMCKVCDAERCRQNYQKNKEERKNKSRQYRLEHIDKVRETGRIYYRENSDKIRVRVAKWANDNPERSRATRQAHYQANKDNHAAQGREWAKANPDKVRAIKQRWIDNDPERRRKVSREWAKDHPEQRRKWRALNSDKYRLNNKAHKAKRRSQMQQAPGSFTRSDLERLYTEQEGRCRWCGVSIFWDIPRDIHVDHVLPLSRGGSNEPSNLALACSDCNLSRGSKTIEEWIPIRGW